MTHYFFQKLIYESRKMSMLYLKKNQYRLDSFVCCDQGCFEGYASIFGCKDSQNDVVCKGAFQKSLKNWSDQGQFPKMLWQHDPTQVIGRWIDIHEDERGLYVKGQLLLDLSVARDAYILLQEKLLDSLSIGYHIKSAHAGHFHGHVVQFLKEVDVMEISLVTFPSNAFAKIHQVKHVSSDITIPNTQEIEAFCKFMSQL